MGELGKTHVITADDTGNVSSEDSHSEEALTGN